MLRRAFLFTLTVKTMKTTAANYSVGGHGAVRRTAAAPFSPVVHAVRATPSGDDVMDRYPVFATSVGAGQPKTNDDCPLLCSIPKEWHEDGRALLVD